MASRLIDPFHRALHRSLTEKIDQRMVELANGGAATFEDYKQQVGYLSALNAVLTLCEELEVQQYGGGEPATES